tara:strand:+ start:191 stop:1528 length:1338 start_codon:yes stop_codon:yes gene_type:complete
MNRCDKCGQEIGKDAQKFYEMKVSEELNKERELRDLIDSQKKEMNENLVKEREAMKHEHSLELRRVQELKISQEKELEEKLSREREQMKDRHESILLQAEKDKEELDKKNEEIRLIKRHQDQELAKFKEEYDKNLNDRLNKERETIRHQYEQNLRDFENQKEQLKRDNLILKEERETEIRTAIAKEKENNRLSNEMMEKKHQLEISKIRKDAQKLLSDSRSMSSELSGEMLEETIKDHLEDWFSEPLYLIEDISKGRKGGDHLISLRVDGLIIGKIKIETKNTKRWDESWINKLSEDMTDYNADYGVLITKTEPEYFEAPWYTKNDHVSICNLKSKNAIKNLIDSYVNILLATYKAKKLKANESNINKCITDWIESPRLKQNVQKLYRSITDNDDDIGKDERAFLKSIKKRRLKSQQERQALQDIFLPLEELELKEISFFDEGAE